MTEFVVKGIDRLPQDFHAIWREFRYLKSESAGFSVVECIAEREGLDPLTLLWKEA